MPAPLASARGLAHAYPDGTVALLGVDLDVAGGSFVAVLGVSGAGKSTLIRCLSSALRPSGGTVSFLGERVDHLRGEARRRHRTRVATIHQRFHLLPRLSVRANVAAGALGRLSSPATWLRRFPAEVRDEADACLARVGLLDLGARRADTLSGGQMQRVAIARALCQRATLLLADEPIAALDPRSADVVMTLLRTLQEQDGLTVIANLHHVDAARRFAERAVGLAGGRVVLDRPIADLDDAALAAIYPPAAESA